MTYRPHQLYLVAIRITLVPIAMPARLAIDAQTMTPIAWPRFDIIQAAVMPIGAPISPITNPITVSVRSVSDTEMPLW